MADQAAYRYDLFIPCANADIGWVAGRLLPALGLPKERILTKQSCYGAESFQPGASVVGEFERGINHSRYTLLVLSPAYLADEWAVFGDQLISHASVTEGRDRLIPLLKRPCTLPLRIDFRVRLDCTQEANWEQEISRLRDLLRQPEPASERIPCPYLGMVPFNEADSGRFFGRDQEAQEMLQRLRLDPFLVVIGPSGSGKSSLVFAGLAPALRKSDLFGSGEWLVRRVRPGEVPLAALTDVLGGDPADPAQVVAGLLATQPGAARLLLVVDQFEEVFTLASRDTLPFQKALLCLAETPTCYVVLTVRADFYADLMRTPIWPQTQTHRIEVLPLDEDGLRQAIVRPVQAEDIRVYLEGELVERLLRDASGEPGALPFVQETLALLWGRLQRRFLPLSAYEALEGAGRTGLQVAMARRADAALAKLLLEQQKIARRIFLRLVQFGEGRADTRRQQPVSALRAADDDLDLFNWTLHHLADHRLLTLSGKEGDPDRKVDLAHEALISGWPRFQEWLMERREAELARRRLEAAAANWEQLERRGGLLDEVGLFEAERWLESSDAMELGYSEPLPALVEASRAAIEEAEREREAARQRELDQARALAEAQQRRAEEQARAARRLRRRAIALVIVLTAVLVTTTLAIWQLRRAQALTRVTLLQLSRLLAAQAESFSSSQPDLALLLSLEAYQAGDTLEARGSLLTTLAANPRLEAYLHSNAGALESLTFSPDSRELATGSVTGDIILWDMATRQSLSPPLTGHVSTVNDLAFSPDGRTLASASCGMLKTYACVQGEIRLWDVTTHQLRGPVLAGHTGWVNSVAFHPSGRILASSGDDGAIFLWDVTTHQLLGPSLKVEDGWILSLAFSPDGRILASSGEDGAIILWDVTTRRPLGPPLTGHTAPVWSVAFSPDGHTLASGSEDHTIMLWDVPTRRPLGSPLTGHTAPVWSVGFSPDGQRLASGGGDNTVILWDVAARQPLGPPLTGHTADVFKVTFSPDGRVLASVSGDGRAIVWDAPGRAWLGQLLIEHTAYVNDIALSPDGRTLALAQDDHTVAVWDIAAGRELGSLIGHDQPVLSVAFSPDGKLLASGSADTTLMVWDATTRQLLGQPLTGHKSEVWSVAFSPDGKLLASGGCGALDENGCIGGEIRLWGVANRQLLSTLKGQAGQVTSLAFSPDGKRLASADQSGQIILWDVGKGERLGQPLAGHTLPIESVVFSPDGTLLASAGDDHQIIVWDIAKRQPLGEPLVGHSAPVLSLAFSPDGQTLASGSADTTIILWDIPTHQQIGRPLAGHESEVWSVVFSPDGQMLVSSDAKRTLTWKVGLAAWRDRACQVANRNLTQDEWNIFIGREVPYRLTCPALPPAPGATAGTAAALH